MCSMDTVTKTRCGSKAIVGINHKPVAAARPSFHTVFRASLCCLKWLNARSRYASSVLVSVIVSRSTCRIFLNNCSGRKPVSGSESSTHPCLADSATRRSLTAYTTLVRASSSRLTAAIATRRSWPSKRPIPILRSMVMFRQKPSSISCSAHSRNWLYLSNRRAPSSRVRAQP